MGIAWMTSWACSAVVKTTDSRRLPARSGPMTNHRSGSSPASSIARAWVDGVQNVLVGDSVLSRRAVDLHRPSAYYKKTGIPLCVALDWFQRISASVIPSAVIPTTVATASRMPRMQGAVGRGCSRAKDAQGFAPTLRRARPRLPRRARTDRESSPNPRPAPAASAEVRDKAPEDRPFRVTRGSDGASRRPDRTRSVTRRRARPHGSP